MPPEMEKPALLLIGAGLLGSLYFGPAPLIGAALGLAGALYIIKRLR